MIGVVILNWNTRELLDRCLRAVVDSELGPDGAKVVVVDNASGDGSLDHVRNAYPRVHAIGLRENVGYARGNNIGAGWLLRQEATLAALLFLNADAAPRTSDALATLARCLARDSAAVGVAAPRLVNDDGTLQASAAPFPTFWPTLTMVSGLAHILPDGVAPRVGTRWSHDRSRDVPWVKGAVLMVRADLWKKLGGFREDRLLYAEDLDICWRAARAGAATRYYVEASFIHSDDASTSQRWDAPSRARLVVDATVAWLRRELHPAHATAVIGVSLAGAVGRSAILARVGRRAQGEIHGAAAQSWARGLSS
jgi:N-acetylglucosaminyl-diphospho-decaprenol L-rhamnosyltransferase